PGDLPPDALQEAARGMAGAFDPMHGGFGSQPKFPHPTAVTFLMHRWCDTRDDLTRAVIQKTLKGMGRGGVYDQLGGGFHRYSVDAQWIVPHFEKMSYDNSELLKNYVHGYQATGNDFFAHIARDIVRWMDEWLTDHGRGGFYASQDADINLEDDGDYFTWTVEEARAALTEEEAKVAELHYDIGEVGEMHHNEAKNVLHVRASIEDIAVRMGTQPDRVQAILDSAKKKMYAARLQRPAPYVDKTVYVNWNALCVSAYLEAARVLGLEDARRFALRSLDRILAEAWAPDHGLRHVIAYSEDREGTGALARPGDSPESPAKPTRPVPGLLDDYAFTALACLDAYETTADLSYFHFAQKIADAMLERFFDSTSGGFFDAEAGVGNARIGTDDPARPGDPKESPVLGALVARRKPFQDSPTPAGNPAAAIALLRLFGYTNDSGYQTKAEETLEVFAGLAEQYGMFAGTYGIAGVYFSAPHIQVVVVGADALADQLYAEAVAPFALNKAVLRLADSEAAPQNLPPALAETIPNLPAVKEGKTVAVVCSGFTCRPPVSDPGELRRVLLELCRP
ncbi:MAG: thioredoxin domain-containing protein, partial [Terriglobales bacterium]